MAVQARPAPPVANAAAASPTASSSGLCLLGTLLCGQNLIQNPQPCLLGLLCSPLPLPSACVGGVVLCGGGVLSQPALPPPVGGVGGPTPGQPGGSTPPVTGQQAAPLGGAANAAAPANSTSNAPLEAPPGVGLVPPPSQVGAAGAPNPDPLAVLLSLSIRDGLSSSTYSVWPWLAGIQVVLLLAIIVAICARQLTAVSVPPGR